MADTAAALVIQLSADFKQFQKEMRAATGAFDAEGRKIEKRQKQLAQNLKNGFSGIGKFIAGGAALYGIERYVSSIVDLASGIKDVADVTKIGTDEIQALGVMAERSGVSQQELNDALEKFSKNLGDASIKGGDALKFYKSLGVNVKGDVTKAFYQFTDAVMKTKAGQQQTALTTAGLGKSAAALTPIIAQGSRALKEQVAQMAAGGQIIKRDAIDKIDDLGDAWGDLKRQFLSTGANAFADPLSKLTTALADPQVQSSLKAFATIMAEVAVALAKVAKYAPIAAGAWAGAKIGRVAGLPGALIGGAIGAVGGAAVSGPDEASLRARLKHAQDLAAADPVRAKDLAHSIASMKAQVAAIDAAAGPAAAAGKPGGAAGGGIDRSDLLGQDAQKRKEGLNRLADLAKADAKDVRDATLQAGQDIRQDNEDTLNSRLDAIRAQDDALLQLAQGTQDYYGLQKQVITELANLDIQSVTERRDSELHALKERAAAFEQTLKDEREARKRQLDELVEQDKISPRQASSSLAELDRAQGDQRAARQSADASRTIALEQATASQVKAINEKKNADLAQSDEDYYKTKQRAIELNDSLRSGLEDVAISGLHGFDSLKDAAASFIEQMAEMILRLYVLKPLIESVLGPAGTMGGGSGLLGSLASLVGFADGGFTGAGGKRQVAGLVHRGEVVFSQNDVRNAGGVGAVEAMRKGFAVPRLTSAASQSPAPVMPYFDLRGAVVTDDLLAQMNEIGKKAANDGARRGAGMALKAQPTRAQNNRLLGT